MHKAQITQQPTVGQLDLKNLNMTNRYYIVLDYCKKNWTFISAHQMVPWDSGNTENWLSKYTVYFLFPMCQRFHQKRDLTL